MSPWSWSRRTYLKFVTSTTSGAGVKIFRPVSKKCELVCFSVKIMNFVFFGVKKSGICVFLVSVENGAGVKKMTNFRYVYETDLPAMAIMTLMMRDTRSGGQRLY